MLMTTKKKYEKPTTQVVEVKMQGILCGSNPAPNYNPWDNQNW